MPRRSNLFQRLAFVIHQSFEPEWKVSESAMLLDSVTGRLREVDIVATRHIGEHEMVLSVECRDHARPAEVTWVEAAAKKHEHLPTSKLVLWSRSGFSKQALLKAKAMKIDTVSQAKATLPIWARFAQELEKGNLQHVTPTYKAFVIVLLPNGQSHKFDAVNDWKFYYANGEVAGSVAAFIHSLAWHKTTEQTLLDHAPPGNGEFWAEMESPVTWFADTPSGDRCQVQLIGAGIKTLREVVSLRAASAGKGDSVLTLATAVLQGGTLELVVEETQDAAPKILSSRRDDKKPA